MPEPTKTPDTAADKAMTAAEAAKAVKRPVQVKEDDKVVTKLTPVKTDEVLSFKDYGTHVVVVTKDGQKFSSAAAA
jgi:hypothetical protein